MKRRTHNKPINFAKPAFFLILAAVQLAVNIYIVTIAVSAWQEEIIVNLWMLAVAAVLYVPALIVILRMPNHSTRLSWLGLLWLFPVVGGVWYAVYGGGMFAVRSRAAHRALAGKNAHFIEQSPKVLEELSAYVGVHGQGTAILNVSGFPVVKNTRSTVFADGEDFLRILVDELHKAKKFIFIECGKLNTGTVFREIFKVLEGKVEEEIEIRLIYDKHASGGRLPRGFRQSCRDAGIDCCEFGRLGVEHNNRMMIVIDGNVAFSSTCSSLSDELLYGGVTTYVLRGDAVWSSSIIFMNMWDTLAKTNFDYSLYRPNLSYLEEQSFVAVFGDSPADQQHPIRTAYLRMISSAQSYVYLQTPTVEPDVTLMQTLKLAADSGVDVRIVTGAPSAGAVASACTRAFYGLLLESGVKVYETDAQLNSKTMVCDDASCLITTAAPDYRSTRRNHECATWIAGGEAVLDIRDDFITAMDDSQEISLRAWRKNVSAPQRLWYAILRAFAPIA